MCYCFLYRQKYLEERKAINSEINDTEDNEIIKICINSPKINKAKQTESKHEEDPLKIPKKRGRKKKIVVEDESSNEELTIKKRGRKKKIDVEDESSNEEIIIKKRGRKKKIVIDDENINEEITEKKICRVNKPPIIKKRDNLFENVY